MPPLLDVSHLVIAFPGAEPGAPPLVAVDGVSFVLDKGKTHCLVGESGCGKTLTALAILGLLPPAATIRDGRVLFEGQDITRLPERAWRQLRGGRMAMIFQEPMTALNPVLRIGAQIAEPLLTHRHMSKKEAWAQAIDLLRQVGIPDPAARAHDFPHQMSGGMRQRAMIAMALACRPALLVADEPTTALDVTIQRQILDLLTSFGEKYGTGLLLITHDLGIVAETADTALIMYAGCMMERSPVPALFSRPLHPYTQGLIASRPQAHDQAAARHGRLEAIPGIVPALADIPAGCAFFDRCLRRMPHCAFSRPPRVGMGGGHDVWCFLYAPDGPEEGGAHAG